MKLMEKGNLTQALFEQSLIAGSEIAPLRHNHYLLKT
jgi:hypothetical protein